MTTIAALLGLLAVAPTTAAGAAAETVERRLTLMGTEASVRVTADDRADALAASEAAVRALEGAEARLSTWTDRSELARLNRATVGEPFALSPELAAELTAAEACRRETGGAFGAAVGPLVDAWGLRTGGRQPPPDALREALAASTGDALTVRETSATRRRAGSRIEEGGFGKGAALDAAGAALEAAFGGGVVRSARVDLGGQVLHVGAAGEGDGIAVADPAERSRSVMALSPEALAGRSVATSGNSERGIVVDGERRSHILDPATGLPVADVGSVTVLAPTGLEADCLSTGLYVMAARAGIDGGADAVLAWAAERPGVDVLLLAPRPDGGLDVTATPGLAGAVRVLDPVAVQTVRIGEDSPARTAGIEGSETQNEGAGAADAWEGVRATSRSK